MEPQKPAKKTTEPPAKTPSKAQVETPTETAKEVTEPPKKTRRFLVMYTITLFSAAALMIVLSYVYSQRMNQQTQEHSEKTQQLSLTALQTVEQLQESNVTLTKELEESKRMIASLQQELETALKNEEANVQKLTQLETELHDSKNAKQAAHDTITAQATALQYLQAAQDAYRRGKLKDARALLKTLQPLAEQLPKVSVVADQDAPFTAYEALVKALD